MKLSQMHDLGGCRAIMASVADVRRLHECYIERPSLFPVEGGVRTYDYIATPKEDGYRGIHIAERYRPQEESRSAWSGHRVEIQLRTRLQHAFSTAVETASTFTRMPLKFGGGNDKWRRFFSVMGTAIAVRENMPPVPNTPTERKELVAELSDLARTRKVRSLMKHWSNALRTLPRLRTTDATWFVLALDLEANTIKATGYTDWKKAAADVAAVESSRAARSIDTVLVSVASIDELRKAYPNYYSDTRAFVSALDAATKR